MNFLKSTIPNIEYRKTYPFESSGEETSFMPETMPEFLSDTLENRIQQGIQKGIRKGIERVALNMLKKGMEISLIVEISELPEEKVLALKEKLSKRNSRKD